MNVTPPEANTEYSRGPAFLRGARDRLPGFSADWIPVAILAGGLLGALLLIVADFTPLYIVKAQPPASFNHSYGTGANHGFAMALIGLVCGGLSYGVWRTGSRPALLAIGVLAVAAVLIALLDDLPDAHSSGLVPAGTLGVVNALSRPRMGFYLETLGAAVLLVTSVGGFLIAGPPTPRSVAAPVPPSRPQEPRSWSDL